MSKTKLSQADWAIVRDAPYWVNAALAAAEGRVAVVTSRREARALTKAISSYNSDNALVQDIVAEEADPAKEVKDATQSTAERNLAEIADIVEENLGVETLDALNAFLLHVGQEVAGAAGEGLLGMGEKVSDKEKAALEGVAEALRATDAHKSERRLAQRRQQEEQWQAEREREQKERAEAQEKERAKAAEEARTKAEAEKKKEEEVRAKAKAEKEKAEKARESAKTEVRQRAEQAKRDEQRQARGAAGQTADMAEKAQAGAAGEAEAAAEEDHYIAEHEVVAGDNLSMISQQYYGTQLNWQKIYEANKEVIGDNPSLIRPGQRLRIPKL